MGMLTIAPTQPHLAPRRKWEMNNSRPENEDRYILRKTYRALIYFQIDVLVRMPDLVGWGNLAAVMLRIPVPHISAGYHMWICAQSVHPGILIMC